MKKIPLHGGSYSATDAVLSIAEGGHRELALSGAERDAEKILIVGRYPISAGRGINKFGKAWR